MGILKVSYTLILKKFKPWLIDWASGRLIALSLKNLHNDNNHLSFQIGRGIIANTTDIENRLSTMALSKIFAPPMKKIMNELSMDPLCVYKGISLSSCTVSGCSCAQKNGSHQHAFWMVLGVIV